MLFKSAAAPFPPFAQIARWASDPQSWIGLIAVITVLGLQVGAFEPEEHHTEVLPTDAAATWTVASSHASSAAQSVSGEPVFIEAPLHKR